MTTRGQAIAAYKDAQMRGDKRGQGKARKQAYRATHDALAYRPRKTVFQRLWARIWRQS